MIKLVFPLEFLCQELGRWEELTHCIVSNVGVIIGEMEAKEIRSLAAYLRDIGKMEYRRGGRDEWLNLLAETGLKVLAGRMG